MLQYSWVNLSESLEVTRESELSHSYVFLSKASSFTAGRRSGTESSCPKDKNPAEEKLGEKLDEKSMRKYLSKLVDYGFLETIGYGKYQIPDPVMYRVFRRM